MGLKAPNSWGLLDMSGNVWERYWDWFNASAYQIEPMTDPLVRLPSVPASRPLQSFVVATRAEERRRHGSQEAATHGPTRGRVAGISAHANAWLMARARPPGRSSLQASYQRQVVGIDHGLTQVPPGHRRRIAQLVGHAQS